MEEWKEYKLGEVAQIQTGPFGSQLHQSDYVDDGVPCIMPTNIGKNLDIISDGIVHISENDAQRLSRHLVSTGDIIYARRGDIEKCAYIQEQQNGWFCGTGCLRIRINKDLDSHFIAYQLSTSEAKRWIVGNAVGTTMLNLNSSILSDLPILIPSLSTQRHISAILKSLDDKIEINQRINDNLEQQAQALFKSWFVDFEPFKDGEFEESELGMIPRNWSVLSFKDFVEPSKEKAPVDSIPEYSVTNNGIIPRDAKFNKKLSKSTSMNKVLRKDNLVFGMSREILNWGIMEDEIGGVSSAYNIYILNKKLVNPTYLRLYIRARISDFSSLIGTAAREGQGLDKGQLMQKRIYVPTENTLQDFFKLYLPIISEKQDLENQVNKLVSLRDALLPRLMSGELNPSEIHM